MASAPYLLLDASARRIHAGLITQESGCAGWLALETSEEESLQAVFDCTAAALNRAGVSLAEIGGFYFAQGPGSLLGLRIAAMAIQGWRSMPELSDARCLSYYSLHAAAAVLRGQETESFLICADYRERQWHCLTVESGKKLGSLALVGRDTLESSSLPVYYVPQRQREQPLPGNAVVWNYDLSELPARLDELVFEECATPPHALPIYEPAPTNFVKWDGERHRLAP